MLKKTAAGCDLLSWEAGLGGLCKQDGKINHKGNLDSFQCCVELCPLPFSSRRKIAEICTMIWEVACRHCPSYSFPAWLFALPASFVSVIQHVHQRHMQQCVPMCFSHGSVKEK